MQASQQHQRQPPRPQSRAQLLGAKDLVIRMLAEVFRVSQTQGGQVRWQQVSTSLVPVSLYSRTTSKWLNYLLSASSAAANNTNSAMSPDSRAFLLLLRQFHQQNLQRPLDPSAAEQSFVVFQVVAHDFLDGQCKKVLNVKLPQPGTRLGRASDYFVYWKEQRLHPSSSFTSSASLARQHLAEYQTSLSPSNLSCCRSTANESTASCSQTWGLNFASINDAKLFYDICSLNLVDLDFNSDYLHQLASLRDNFSLTTNPSLANTDQGQQRIIRDFLNYKQQQLHSQQVPAQPIRQAKHQPSSCHSRQFANEQASCAALRQPATLIDRCSTCNQQTHMSTADHYYPIDNQFPINNECLVHHQRLIDESSNPRQNPLRNRSRSTTRQPKTCQPDDFQSGKRARSFSTPASPDHKDARYSNVGHHHQFGENNLELEYENHHPRCLSFIRKQKELSKKQSTESERPQKPARGVLRDAAALHKIESNHQAQTSMLEHQNSVVNSSQALHSKRTPKARYMGHIVNKVPKHSSVVYEQKSCAYQCSKNNHLQESEMNPQASINWLETTSMVGSQNQSFTSPQDQNSSHLSVTKSNKSQRRKSTAVDTRGFEHLSSISRRNARLARAQYANSKNMKEFLSLDAAGLQSTPTQLAALNERFQQQMRVADCKKEGAKKQEPIKRPPLCNLNENSSDQVSEYPQAHKRVANSSEKKNTQQHEFDAQRIRNETSAEEPVQHETGGLILDATHNASTTTDDLPMDPQMKKRMFKPTSDEIISERTEPKSLSSPSANPYFDYAQKDELDRQVRAVSLGPELDSRLRCRSARSEAGRRKSLERTTCVDLESNLPLDTIRKSHRLSPLAQESFQSCNAEVSGSSVGFVSVEKEEYKENMKRSEIKNASSASQGRITCSSQMHDCMKRDNPFRLLPSGEEIYQACQHQEANHPIQRMISFKSAPDVSQFCRPDGSLNIYNDCKDYNADGYHQNYSHRQDSRARAAGVGLSSYAVPLCLDDGGDQHGYFRKFYSCPNSLRRKQRVLHQQEKPSSGTSYALSSTLVDGCHGPACARALNPDAEQFSIRKYYGAPELGENIESGCQFCSSRLCPHDMSPGNCDSCAATNLAGGFSNKSCAKQQYLCRHNRFTCMTNVSGGRGSGRHEKKPPAGSLCANPLHYRPCSSQSSRSPLRYGLYESDCEDEPLMDDGQLSQSKPCRYIGGRSEPHDHAFRLCSNTEIKPVKGYDLTMARSSCKARQRAKSQPPAEETSHLTKSMENVEKLIKEVQNELNLLRSQPLSLSRREGSKRSDDTRISATEATEKSINQQTSMPTSTISVARNEMLREENSTPGQLNDSSKVARLSSSSATRRAAQFKCVGAIRKAGFLSVKKWILKRRQSIELARKQGWKRYWVCLRGTALLFHSVIDKKDDPMHDGENRIDLASWIRSNCGNQMQTLLGHLQSTNQDSQNMSQEAFLESVSQCYIEKEPRHLIIIESAIAQPIPEHPKRDHVFCLSTTFGDAYLFQSACRLESENWISAVHNACAASIARDLTRDEAMKLFETRIRQLELEAEKKLFLRQRLDSRLTSMSSMSHISNLSTTTPKSIEAFGSGQEKGKADEDHSKKITMRALLIRLNQQLNALDTYIEQVHCEVYQLRCYLSSCGNQQLFYQNIQQQQRAQPPSSSPAFLSLDLPHPRSLLMHVCKNTKQLLIKLGIFTVSSFHAYIHARQGSADSILNNLQQASQNYPDDRSPVELRIRSRSISETLLSRSRNAALDDDTEKLIDISNLKALEIRLTKELYNRIRGTEAKENVELTESDDRFSISHLDHSIQLNMKIHSSTSAMSIIKQALRHLTSDSSDLDFLNYYLQLHTVNGGQEEASRDKAETAKEGSMFVAKRREILSDWQNFDYLQLMEKIVFRVELSRKRIDEEAAPFGISIGAQLFLTQFENSLNVYCSYIEWGSVADRVGLKDDDEFLVINGVPVMDLDMMFIECIIQDESNLKLVVRSSRTRHPPGSQLIDKTTWRPAGGGDDTGHGGKLLHQDHVKLSDMDRFEGSGSQVISDEYISSLVCPPPPTQSCAFLRTDSTLLRQKSDLSVHRPKVHKDDELVGDKVEARPLTASNKITDISDTSCGVPKAKSAQDLKLSPNEGAGEMRYNNNEPSHQEHIIRSGLELASQLLEKTEQLTELIGKNPLESWSGAKKDSLPVNLHEDQGFKADLNSVERLRKSILELLETEYAYIRHLETVIDHYMKPLKDIDFLNITDLRTLNDIVNSLVTFQKHFFDKLTGGIIERCELIAPKYGNEFEELNSIAQQLNSFKDIDQFKPLLMSLAQTFLDDAEKFRLYGSYCVVYSRLQKLLHPKRPQRPSLSSTSIISTPNAFDTFLSGSSGSAITLGSQIQHREFLKPLGSFLTHNEPNGQLKQLTEFLGHLDSSSSSASLSLPRSSPSESGTVENKKAKTVPPSSQFPKSVHQQNFESYLIKPIQRIVKYPMLLGSITYSAQVFGKGDVFKDLQGAVKQMESMTSHVNDTQRIHDEYGSIFEHMERQFLEHRTDFSKTNSNSSTSSHQPPISLSIEQLLYFGPVDWLNINEYTSELKKETSLSQMLFVFNSCVLFICKEHVKTARKKLSMSSQAHSSSLQATGISGKHFHKSTNEPSEVIRYQSVIPVSEVQVRAVPTSSAQSSFLKENHYQWELFRCSSVNSNSNLLTKQNRRSTAGKVYLLASSSNDQRNGFLRKIRFIIRESVRNMSLPVARSPSSKSLTPKKLSSPSSGANSNSSCSHSSLSPECTDTTKPCKRLEKDIECKFAGQVQNNNNDNNYKTSIEVNH